MRQLQTDWRQIALPVVHRICVSVDRSLHSTWSDESLKLSTWDGLPGIGCALADIDECFPLPAAGYTACENILHHGRRWFSTTRGRRKSGILSGDIGALLCFSKIAMHLGLREHLEWIEEAVRHLADRGTETSSVGDFGSGLAGDLAGLVWAFRVFKINVQAPIRRRTEELIKRVASVGNSMALDPEIVQIAPLCGITHGASGAAVALLEAGLFLEDDSLCALACRLADYDLLAQYTPGYWPDFRLPLQSRVHEGAARDALNSYRTGDAVRSNAGVTWCHGASGILATQSLFARRLRSLKHHATYRRLGIEVLSGIRLERSNRNACVCHGLASAMALFSDKQLIQASHVRRAAATFVDKCQAVLMDILREDDVGFDSYFPTPGLEQLPQQRMVRQWGYFTGVSGLAATYIRLVNGKGQHDLLLPFEITRPSIHRIAETRAERE